MPARKAEPRVIDQWPQYRRSYTEIMAPRAPVVYLVQNFIRPGTINIPYGIPGSMKTMVIMDLAMAVATGCDWRRPAPYDPSAPAALQVKQVKVLWIDYDNGSEFLDERWAAVGRNYGVTPVTCPAYYSMADPQFDASKKSHIDDMVDLILFEQAGLVVFDNLMTISGGRDENSSEMGPVITGLRRITEKTGAAVVPIHHSRKENGNKTGSTLRGHSSINGGIDLGFLIDREQGSDVITITPEKVRGAPIKPFSMEFSYTHKPGTTELETACFFGVSNPQKVAMKKTTAKVQDAILQILKALSPGQTLTQDALAKQAHSILQQANVNTGINAIKNEITSMALNGLIRQQSGARNSIQYSL